MKNLSILLLGLFSTYGFAQFHITGMVVDSQNIPLEGCHIHHKNECEVTKADGKFHIGNLEAGNHWLKVTYLGFKTLDTLVSVTAHVDIILHLQPEATTLQSIEVKAISIQSKPEIMQKINVKILEKNSEKSLAEVLKNLSGISVLKTGTTVNKPIINGLHSSRVPIIANGAKLEDQEWGIEHAPTIDALANDKIVLIKGAKTLQYSGNAMSGLVLTETTELGIDTLMGKTILGYIANGKGGFLHQKLGYKKNKFSVNTAITSKYLGDKKTPTYYLSNSGNREISFLTDAYWTENLWKFKILYSYFTTEMGILKASHIGNTIDLYNAILLQQPYFVDNFSYKIDNPKQKVKHQTAKFKINKHFDDFKELSFEYNYQHNNRLEFDVRRNTTNNSKASLDLTLRTHTADFVFENSKQKFGYILGLQGNFQQNTVNYETGIQPLIPQYKKVGSNFFAIFNLKFGTKLSTEVGLRYDFTRLEAQQYYKKNQWINRGYVAEFQKFVVKEEGTQVLAKPVFDYHNFSKTVSGSYVFSTKFIGKISGSVQMRNPNPSELFSNGLHHSSGMIEYGNLRLKREVSTQIFTAINYNFNHLTIEIQPFYNKIQHFMYLKPIGFEQTIRGSFPVWEYQKTDAVLKGIDLVTHYNINNYLTYNLKINYVKGKNTLGNIPLVDMPPFSTTQSVVYQSKSKNFSASLEHEWVTQQKEFPNYDFQTLIIDENGNQKSTLVAISKPTKAYQLWNASVDYYFSIYKNKDTTIRIVSDNIFNTLYRNYLNRHRFFADEMGRNINFQLVFNY